MSVFLPLNLKPLDESLPAVIPPNDEVDYPIVSLPGPRKALVLQDIHIPYHDPIAVQAAVFHGIKKKCDTVLINGDYLDGTQLSNFNKDPRTRPWQEELKMGRQMLKWIRKNFKKAEIIFKLGNHDEWWEMFVNKHPQLAGMSELDPKNLLGMDDLDVRIVRDGLRIKLGQLTVLHGHELGKGLVSSVNPARSAFLRCGTSVLIGHLHIISQHFEKTLDGRKIYCYSGGCLCGLHPKYARINKWEHGSPIVEVTDDEGHFLLNNHYIENGTVY